MARESVFSQPIINFTASRARGNVGYLISGIKVAKEVTVGDTITKVGQSWRIDQGIEGCEADGIWPAYIR